MRSLRQDRTLAGETWLIPDFVILVIFKARLLLFLINFTPERIFFSVMLVTSHIIYSK